MNTVYVLMEEGWDYNDEIFFQSEAGGGTPRNFYESEDAANKECQRRNLKSFKELWENGEIQQYCYGITELLPYEERKDKAKKKLLNETCEKLFGKDFDELDEAFNDQEKVEILDHSEEAWATLYNLMKLSFWNVVEVERA
jgi:hypothetical protein